MALLGVDGGGSKITVSVAQNDGTMICNITRNACGNHQRTSPADAANEIRMAVLEALTAARVSESEIVSACFGLAGADYDRDLVLLQTAIYPLFHFSGQINIVCDTVIGLRLGAPDMVGVVIVSGTGTNAYGRNQKQEVCQIGGFGYLFGDFGGGYHMAIEVTRAVFRAWDGRGPSTTLTELVLNETGCNSVENLFDKWLDQGLATPPLDFAKLLFPASHTGDAVALQILFNAGRELGIAANAVLRKLSLNMQSIPVVAIGSLVQKGGGELTRALQEEVTREHPLAKVVIPSDEPISGAIALARDQLIVKKVKNI